MDDDSATRRRKRTAGIAQAYRTSHEIMSAAIGIAIFAGAGYWLDLKLGWKPVLTICGAILGMISAGFSLRRLLARLDRESPPGSTRMKARDE
ncbi:MAG: AtpZ/AtpI family protein [Planctomycetaceae bacterium]